jgi:hypothetical protein
MIVITGSRRAQVMAIESTPDSGVDTKKAAEGPRPAPCWRKPIAAGIAPQEQSGNGIPKREALITAMVERPPRCLATASEDDVGSGIGEDTPGLNQQMLEKLDQQLTFSSHLLALPCAREEI